MTARVAAELVDDLHATGRGWVEALWPGHQARAAAVAVLPTVTEHSRTSLLCGRIVSGTQQTERTGHPAYVTSLGGGTARIFHKSDLDSVEDGYRLAHPVHDAIADISGVGLVTCVLNTIDDALDRSDPEGIEWRLPTVKHLDALLDLAATMGRPVILTSDHGHVLERRKGRLDLPTGATATSARSRSAKPRARPGELLVEGPQVVGGRAVLAVDELLRYSKLKAGYHGGAAAADVAVPVVLLWPGTPPPDSGYAEAPIQQPAWWDVPTGGFVAPPASASPLPAAPTLFDLPAETPAGLGRAVVGSAVWQRQVRTAGRFDLSAEQCAILLDQLAAASGTRLARPAVARALGVSIERVNGAVAYLVKVLNVEG